MSQLKKVITSTMLGNGLEWYDYALYATFTPLITRHFFPQDDPAAALIATFGIFAVGFVMRPFGAMLFGWIGDTFGRKNALALSILMMAFPTACIGLLPTYQAIGLWAPLLLVIIRLIQGVAVGGEYGGSIVYLVEHASSSNRNVMGSLSVLSMLMGLFLGAGLAAGLAHLMSVEDYERYGWRIPFILGFFIALIGWYIRTRLDESPAFAEAKREGHIATSPIKETFQHYPEILIGVGLYLAVTIPFYIQTVFMHSFLINTLHVSTAHELLIFCACLMTLMLVVPFSAWLADRYDRENLLMAALVGYAIFAIPYVALLDTQNFAIILGAQLLFSMIMGVYIAPIPTLMTQLFPIRTRCSGMSITMNVAAALFGGTAPMFLTHLITLTGSHRLIAFYILLAALISLGCVSLIKARRRKGQLFDTGY